NKRLEQTSTVYAKLPGSYKDGEGIVCDRSQYRTDICTIFGHVQMHASSGMFLLDAQDKHNSGVEEKIRPYTRKWERSVMDIVHEVTMKSVMFPNNSNLCDVVHNVPAIVFTTGGYTGNLYHEFNDGIIPLYITSQHLEKEVVFVIVDFHNWWLTKYDEVLKQLTQYRVINFENETKVHCFPEVTAGLFIHGELMVDSTLMFQNKSILDFRALLNHAYTPHWFVPDKSTEADNKPRLVVLVRVGSRMILNLNEVVELAEQIGFNVTIWKPLRTTELKTTYRLLNFSHVLLGVHGAALTHLLFMRPGSVFIQVIPLGTDWAAQTYFGEPAERMGIHYMGYNIDIQESTLSRKYDRNDLVLKNPKAVVKKGWEATKQVYLESQDVIINLSKFRRTLIYAKKKVKKITNQM
ncbi:hypothetical protein KI387_022543, partial [Taxus chinensis]